MVSLGSFGGWVKLQYGGQMLRVVLLVSPTVEATVSTAPVECWWSKKGLMLPRAAERVEAIPSEARSNFAIHLIPAHCASAFGRPRHLEQSCMQTDHLRDVSSGLKGQTPVSSLPPWPLFRSCHARLHRRTCCFGAGLTYTWLP